MIVKNGAYLTYALRSKNRDLRRQDGFECVKDFVRDRGWEAVDRLVNETQSYRPD